MYLNQSQCKVSHHPQNTMTKRVLEKCSRNWDGTSCVGLVRRCLALSVSPIVAKVDPMWLTSSVGSIEVVSSSISRSFGLSGVSLLHIMSLSKCGTLQKQWSKVIRNRLLKMTTRISESSLRCFDVVEYASRIFGSLAIRYHWSVYIEVYIYIYVDIGCLLFF